MRMYTLCFKNGIGGRFQLPDDFEFRPCLFSYIPTPFSGNNTFLIILFWKPLYIPSTDAFDIPHDKLESIKIERSDCIKTHIEQDKGPLKEGISGISWGRRSVQHA